MSEHLEQCKLFELVWYNRLKYPLLNSMFAIPNGGMRNLKVAVKLKKEGVKAGVPDLFLPVPKKGFAGYFIEMKWGRNKPTPAQKNWLKDLKARGYKTDVFYSATKAFESLVAYIT